MKRIYEEGYARRLNWCDQFQSRGRDNVCIKDAVDNIGCGRGVALYRLEESSFAKEVAMSCILSKAAEVLFI